MGQENYLAVMFFTFAAYVPGWSVSKLVQLAGDRFWRELKLQLLLQMEDMGMAVMYRIMLTVGLILMKAILLTGRGECCATKLEQKMRSHENLFGLLLLWTKATKEMDKLHPMNA
jgi:hypothetical protein